MMYLSPILWSMLEIGFAYLFLSSFSENKRSKKDTFYYLLTAWLLNTVLGFLIPNGIYHMLAYLLIVVLLLLCVFDEYGAKGLFLLIFAFLIPFMSDTVFGHLASDLGEFANYALITLGKALALLCACAIKFCRKNDGKNKISEDSEVLLLRQHMEMQQESMAALEQNYRLQRKSTHEFEHHMQVLRDLLGNGETQAAKDYLHRLKKNRAIHTISVSSGHPVTDVILNQKYQTARQNEIKMQVQVNDLSALQIPSDSLAVILTNLLDNAMEACLRVDGYREIRCCVLYDEGLYISIKNTSLPVQITDGKIPTAKEDSLSHGYGLLSVSYVLDKLGAEYNLGYEDGWFYFSAEIE